LCSSYLRNGGVEVFVLLIFFFAGLAIPTKEFFMSSRANGRLSGHRLYVHPDMTGVFLCHRRQRICQIPQKTKQHGKQQPEST
jgi:hypothetical protein